MIDPIRTDKFRTTTVQCPSCKGKSDTKFGLGNLQAHDCRVCGRQWVEMIQIETKRVGQPEYLSAAAKNHPNLSSYNQRLIMDVFISTGHFCRKYLADPCGVPGCKNFIKDFELILAQSLEDGWPPQRSKPYMCASHYWADRKAEARV